MDNNELEEYKQKAEDYLNAWKRTAADFENYKKRREREDKELAQFAQEITVVKILPTLESLEQALKNAPSDEKFRMWTDGMIKIVQQLEKGLMEMGIEKIGKKDEKFDPNIHEAVDMENAEIMGGQLIVKEVVQTGYKLNNKIIRPAKVRVGL